MNITTGRHSWRRAWLGLVAGGALLSIGALGWASDPAPAEPAPEHGTAHEVSQQQKTFAPGEITVEVGDEVVFLNDDEISHNVFSRTAGEKFNLKIQHPGEHKSHRFERPGTAVVRCAIHPKMKLVVNVVEQAPETAAPVAAEPTPAGAAAADTAVAPVPASPEVTP